MYRLLIVDDEPIIVEGLGEWFRQSGHPLEVYQAYDGPEALEMARKLRMDILLTDIEMPEMNGIELQRELSKLWPRCRSIFLTGYNEFDYVQSTIRAGAVDYVLKTEGDDPIVAAVEKAIASLSEEVAYDRLIADARQQLTLALPALRKDYLTGLLQGEAASYRSLRAQFDALDIPLDPASPFVLAIGRIDKWRDDAASMERSLFTYSIDNIFGEFFSADFLRVHFLAETNRLVWLLQPKNGKFASGGAKGETEGEAEATADLQAYLLGMLESVQTACGRYLKLECSFVVSGEPCGWEALPEKYESLSLLFGRGLGLGSQTLLSDERTATRDEGQARGAVKRIRLLDQYFRQKEREKFGELFERISAAIGDPPDFRAGLPLETFYELTAIFISHINRLDAYAELSRSHDLGKLFAIHSHASWAEAANYFRGLAESLFGLMADGNERETNEVVELLHGYVEANLDGDLSLNRLSDHVYLTPFYLSRLYKQKTGESISDYITRTRVEKAKSLLGESALKIHEVGMRVGYDSASYFARFFKKATRLTPQEYRDSLKKI